MTFTPFCFSFSSIFIYFESQYCSAVDKNCHLYLAGIPSELIEDSKFVPLNADDPVYGPPVSSG